MHLSEWPVALILKGFFSMHIPFLLMNISSFLEEWDNDLNPNILFSLSLNNSWSIWWLSLAAWRGGVVGGRIELKSLLFCKSVRKEHSARQETTPSPLPHGQHSTWAWRRVSQAQPFCAGHRLSCDDHDSHCSLASACWHRLRKISRLGCTR